MDNKVIDEKPGPFSKPVEAKKDAPSSTPLVPKESDKKPKAAGEEGEPKSSESINSKTNPTADAKSSEQSSSKDKAEPANAAKASSSSSTAPAPAQAGVGASPATPAPKQTSTTISTSNGATTVSTTNQYGRKAKETSLVGQDEDNGTILIQSEEKPAPIVEDKDAKDTELFNRADV